MKLITFSLLLTATVACATTTTTTTEEATMSSATTTATNAERICAEECAWWDRCGVQTLAVCTPRCLRRYVNQGETLREKYVAHAETCFPSLTCSQIDDVCLEHWGADQDIAEMHACIDRNAECGGSFYGLCYAIPALTDVARATAAACLTQDCARAKRCVKQSLGVN